MYTGDIQIFCQSKIVNPGFTFKTRSEKIDF